LFVPLIEEFERSIMTMKAAKSFRIAILLPLLIPAFCIAGIAQEAGVTSVPVSSEPAAQEQDVFFFKQTVSGGMFPPVAVAGTRVFDHAVTFISAMDHGSDRVVTGAPYSADAVTETVQMLADGNRIVKKVSSRIARDREGRSRRDQTLEAIGPWVAANSTPQVSFIMDPVGKVQWILEHETRTARQLPLGNLAKASVMTSGVAGPQPGTFEVAVPPVAVGIAGAGRRLVKESYETRTESLGKRFIEGVEAEGTRVVTTIPAGAIGNERPIDMIAETWYVPSLQLVALSRNSDPRFGETTYRLENLSLLEPVSSLFEAPRDYTISRGPSEGLPPREIRKLVIPQ
jgi:hypothetical protein